MPLAQEDLELIKQQVGDYVKDHISDWITEQSLGKPAVVYEIELRERMVRVEEELKAQRALMREGFESQRTEMNLRFEQVDKRFEQVDKRLDLMKADMDKRFEQVDKRFEEMIRRHDRHFMWLVGFIATGVGVVITAMRYLPLAGSGAS